MERTRLRKRKDVAAEMDNNRTKQHSIQMENLISHIKEKNPFSDNYDENFLFNISTGQIVDEDTTNFLLNVKKKKEMNYV